MFPPPDALLFDAPPNRFEPNPELPLLAVPKGLLPGFGPPADPKSPPEPVPEEEGNDMLIADVWVHAGRKSAMLAIRSGCLDQRDNSNARKQHWMRSENCAPGFVGIVDDGSICDLETRLRYLNALEYSGLT
jgi:hypothetical protein